MNEELITAINNRIYTDKLTVNYIWLQQQFNLSPIEAESCMKDFLNKNELVSAEFLKCHLDNIECTNLISLKPSSDTILDVSHFELSNNTENKRVNFISCLEAQRVYKSEPMEETTNPIINEAIKNTSKNISKKDKCFFPSQLIKKVEYKPKASAQKNVKNKSIKESIKKFESIFEKNTPQTIVKMEEKADGNQEDVMEIEIVPVTPVINTDDVAIIETEVKEETSGKRLNIFENFDEESPKQSKVKRRRLIIESDDSDDDKVLVNDSMIEETEVVTSSTKKTKKERKVKKETTNTSKKRDKVEIIKESKANNKEASFDDSEKPTKRVAKKIAIEDEKRNILIDSMTKNKETEVKKESFGSGTKKRKVMKHVERTFKDEDGFLVTQKVMEAVSDDEDVENIGEEKSEVVNIVEKKVVVKPIAEKKPATKKSVANNSDGKKSTQMNIMSFFKKKD